MASVPNFGVPSQGLAQQNAYNQQYLTSNTGSLGGGLGVSMSSTSACSWVTIPVIMSPNATHTYTTTTAASAQIAIPYQPNGVTNIVWITDAKGTQIAIEVDSSVMGLINHINQIHAMNPGRSNAVYYTPPPSPAYKMVEGDFSMDELEQAKELMESLNEKQEGDTETCAADCQQGANAGHADQMAAG